ncbi:hypothetical protein [Kitasatospora kifunensis]|uniref:Uncharacterized protein n=1 Tax=Kitasatospora kifunensis TaxID=58351 RepID=A0A7W7QYZ5_KITKI|nr:hypothetical protein [Kitasatospora kifunensis]MBB4922190.1 hypothetical protein [Kitasatospora kifunensis]
MSENIGAVPKGHVEIRRLGMSNFDHAIDPGFEDRLRNEAVWGRHAARNFNGRVWFENDAFHEQVWCYGHPVAHFSAPTLPKLMEQINNEYGWE